MLNATYDASNHSAPEEEMVPINMGQPPNGQQHDKDETHPPQNRLAPRNPLDKQNTAPAQIETRPIKVPPTNLLIPTSNSKNLNQQSLTRDWDPTELFEAETAFTQEARRRDTQTKKDQLQLNQIREELLMAKRQLREQRYHLSKEKQQLGKERQQLEFEKHNRILNKTKKKQPKYRARRQNRDTSSSEDEEDKNSIQDNPKPHRKKSVYSIRKDGHSDETNDSDKDRSPSPKPNSRRPRGKEPTKFRGAGELLGEFARQHRRYTEWERQEGRDAADMLSFSLKERL